MAGLFTYVREKGTIVLSLPTNIKHRSLKILYSYGVYIWGDASTIHRSLSPRWLDRVAGHHPKYTSSRIFFVIQSPALQPGYR